MDIRKFILSFLFFVGFSGAAGTDANDSNFVEQEARHESVSPFRTDDRAAEGHVPDLETNQSLQTTIAAAQGD